MIPNDNLDTLHNIKMESEIQPSVQKDSPGRKLLKSFMNKNFRIKMTDGRILIGLFLCTDSDANIILGMCSEFRDEEERKDGAEVIPERSLGLVIVPKRHIVRIEIDASDKYDYWQSQSTT